MSMHLVLVVAAVVALNLPATPDNVANSPLVTFRPDRSQFLSTESASGTLTITNTTSSEVGYNPLGGAFLIRQPDGSQYEDRWFKVWSGHPISYFWIEPKQSQMFHIWLPGCEVVSDPCAERITIKLELLSKTQQQLSPVTTPEFAYTFVPDPSVTFRVEDLRDNRPLVIAQTQTRDASAVARFLNADPLEAARGLNGNGTDTASVGARPLASIPERFGMLPVTTEYLGVRWEDIGPPSLSVTIAADRPEIFALVGLKKERCQHFGYNCDAVGVVRATQRIGLLARALGVGARYVSLITLYRDNTLAGHDTIMPIGVAMTMSNENLGAWRRLATPTPQPSGLVTFGMMKPTPLPDSFLMRYRRTPAPDPVPIAVADDTTTVSGDRPSRKSIYRR